MALFGGSRGYVAPEPEKPKTVYEVEEIYGQGDVEIHLVLAVDEEDAVIRHLKTKERNPDRIALGYKAQKCIRYKSITLGSRKYI